MADQQYEVDPAVIAPPIGADAGRLKSWVDGGLTYSNRFRIQDVSRWRRAELYDDGKQWLRKAATGYDSPGQYSQWVMADVDPTSPDYIPMPVINEGRGVLSNEAAQLAKPNYRPTVIPSEDTLEARLGAQAARELLKWRLRDMDWPGESQLFYYRKPLHGGAWLKSEWVKSWDKTGPAPVQNAVACAQHKVNGGSCDFVLADPMMAAEKTMGFPENTYRVKASENGAPQQAQVFACPTCPSHPPLTKYMPTMEEAYKATDTVGRPLGRQLPVGDWWLTVRSPYDVFPRDLGFNQNWLDVTEWSEAHVETLDWVALRYPEKAGQVKPENPARLSEYHPVVGSPNLYGGYESKLFLNSTRVKERHKLPWMEKQENGEYRMNRGRSVVMAGEVVLEDGPLMIESLTKPGNWIEQRMMVFVPWEFLDGGRRLAGLGIWDLMFDPQDGLNECVSQEQNIRQRCAVPFILAARSHNLETPANQTGIAGRYVTFDIDANAPEQRPTLMNNETAPSGISNEAAFYRDEISRLPGRAAVERGETPSNQISAAAAIENLKTYVSETRQPRLERIKAAFKKVWSHGLQLMAALYLEPRPVRAEDDDGEERWKMLKGTDLHDQADVEVEADPDYDVKARNQSLTFDYIQQKVINPQDPKTARLIAKIFEGEASPKEFFQDATLQEDEAQREWIAFRDRQMLPIVDPILDDHEIHVEMHARASTTETFRKLAERAGWRLKVLPILQPLWEQLKLQAQTMPAQPMKPDPSGAVQPGPPDPLTGLPTQVPVMVPAGPPMTLQERVIRVWSEVLAVNGFKAEDPKTLSLVLAWKAHEVQHQIEGQAKQMAVQQGAVLPAPPGTPNLQGMEPTMQQDQGMNL